MDDNEPSFRGGCLCGKVRYEITGHPLHVSLCYCRNCQKNTGSAFSVNAVFPEEAAQVTGQLAMFEDEGDSGFAVQRLFCPSCGTPIRSMAKQTAGMFVLKAGSLDEPGSVTPTDAVYCQSRVGAWTGVLVEHAALPSPTRRMKSKPSAL